MVKQKLTYEAPEIKVTHVELESSICAGSVDFKNPNENAGRIEAQTINKDFKSENENNYFNTGWESGSTSSTTE